MKRLASITATLVLCASISSASAQEEQININNPSSSEESISVLSSFTIPPQPGSILLLDGQDDRGRSALDYFGYSTRPRLAPQFIIKCSGGMIYEGFAGAGITGSDGDTINCCSNQREN